MIVDNKGLQEKEKSQMRKVVVEEDSSEGEDVDFKGTQGDNNHGTQDKKQDKDNQPQGNEGTVKTETKIENKFIEEIPTVKTKEVQREQTYPKNDTSKDKSKRDELNEKDVKEQSTSVKEIEVQPVPKPNTERIEKMGEETIPTPSKLSEQDH